MVPTASRWPWKLKAESRSRFTGRKPGSYWRLRESLRAFRDRADFAIISSNPEDSLPEVAAFLAKAGIEGLRLELPLRHRALSGGVLSRS